MLAKFRAFDLDGEVKTNAAARDLIAMITLQAIALLERMA
jgi:hypothetical protein